MRMYFNSSPSVLPFRSVAGTVLFLCQTGASCSRLHGPLYFLTRPAFDRISCDEDQIISCRQRRHLPVTFLHEPSGPVAPDSVAHFLTRQKPCACIGKTILFVEQDHIAVPYRFSLVIHRTELTAACEHFLPAHTCTAKLRTDRLRGQSLSASCSSVLQNVTAASGLHSLTEAMFLFSLPCLGLESHFHNIFLL